MRVAYVCADPGVPVFGAKGCSVHVQEVIRGLLEHGATVTLFAGSTGGEAPVGLEGVALHRLPAPAKGDPPHRERAALAANRALRNALAEAGAFDLVYERYSLWSHAGMAFAREVEIPGLLEVNALLIEEQERHRQLHYRTAAEGVAQQIFRDASHLIAVSDGIGRYLSEFPGVSGRVHVIPNGVDPRRFAPAEEGRRAHGFTVGFVGSLKPWHGLPALIDAFTALHLSRPDAELLIVGDGPERPALAADLVARGLQDAARFTGAVAHADVPALLATMDVAVAPYPDLPDFYFSPLKLFEYMAAGLPTVASAIGQIDGILQHERNGLLYRPGDVAGLAAALRRLAGDYALRRRLGEAARLDATRRHSWEGVVGRILAVAAEPPPGAAC